MEPQRAEARASSWFGAGGARLGEPPPPELAIHRNEDAAPKILGVHWFDTAHAVMLTEQGLIPREHGIAILRALREMEAEGVESARAEAGGGLHSGERYLAGRLGEETSGWLHLGRSSADLSAVGLRVALRSRLLDLREGICATRQAVIRIARREPDTLMPGYTHGQQAQPITLAHWLAMWGCVLERDGARIANLLGRLDESPAGAAAIAGSDFPLDRRRTAELLGFAEPARNTLDAVHSHDLELECLATLAILAGNLARLAEDILKWSATEFGLLELADRYCVTSSILAQKKNPHAPQAIRAAAAVAVGALASGFYVNKEPTAEAILDQATGLQQPLWRTFELLAARVGELPDMLETMTFARERMAELATDSWAQAADIAGALVREQRLPWRTAHQIVAALVRRCIEEGIALAEVTPEVVRAAAAAQLGETATLSADALAAALDPRESVRRRTLIGGPAPVAVEATLDALERALEADRAQLADARERIRLAQRRLRESVTAILGDGHEGHAALP